MAAEWHISEVVCILGVTAFCAGFTVGPMFLAPFSEIIGRKSVFDTAVPFMACQPRYSVTRLYAG